MEINIFARTKIWYLLNCEQLRALFLWVFMISLLIYTVLLVYYGTVQICWLCGVTRQKDAEENIKNGSL